jgi:5-(carboxyamino)imidazole ribonucleotide synthase
MIAPGATLGVLGGGQLGRMFAMAAHRMGYRVVVLDPDPHAVAGAVADRHLCAPMDDEAALDELARSCEAVTVETENVPTAALARLAQRVVVGPSAHCVAIAQDRFREKRFVAGLGLATAPYAEVSTAADLAPERIESLLPGILKTSRSGYDGKGQARVNTAAETLAAFERFGGVPAVLEAQVALALELSVVLARGADGSIAHWPVAENRHEAGILDVSIMPARIAPKLAARAVDAARAIAHALEYRGVLCVEFFVRVDGALLVNEIAPRPHNSGHATIDASRTSQFEQQVRALAGLPLGDTALTTPIAMQNLLGDLWSNGAPRWEAILAQPGAALHLYGKREARPGRKMGHFTCVAPTVDEALEVALRLRRALPRDAAVARAEAA